MVWVYAKPKTILTFFKKAEDEGVRMKACFYGKPGVGKTVAALQFPNVVVIDLEKGTTPYGSDYDFHVLRTQNLRDIEGAVRELMKDPGEFKTLVIDPMSVYCDLVEQDFLNQKKENLQDPNAVLQGLDYVPIKNTVKTFVNNLLSLDMNIVVTARQKDVYPKGSWDPSGVTPDMRKEVSHMFDTIVYIYIDKDTGERKGIAHPDIVPGVDAKDRTKLPREAFVFDYKTLESFWGIEGLSRKAEPVANAQITDSMSVRDTEIIQESGAALKTAGITAKQLALIEGRVGSKQENKEEFSSYLYKNYGIGSMLDLREDEAGLVINSMKKPI